MMAYGSWDLTPPLMPARSRLYPLVPAGLGTSAVESLTSYVVRLAAAHRVQTRALVRHEILPLLGRAHLLKPINNSLSAFWCKDTRGINGIGTFAQAWVGALEHLTLRPDLRFLTVLPWGAVLPRPSLLRATRAWCPACYQRWHETGQPLYDPLLWAFRAVTVCPRHQAPLQHHCPHPACGRTQSPLSPRACSGYCASCGCWLGAAPGAGAGDGRARATDQQEVWRARAIGDLLAATPTLPCRPARGQIAAMITAMVETVTGGNVAALADALQFDRCTVWQWKNGVTIPALALLLQLCEHLNLAPLQVLTGQPQDLRAVLVPAPGDARGRVARTRTPRSAEGLRRALETIIAAEETPPPSVRAVAHRLGFRATASLYGRFPDLCRIIAQRRQAHRAAGHDLWRERLRAEVRQATIQLHQQGVYPASVRVAALLIRPGHFRHPIAVAAWQETMRALDLG